MEKCEEHAMFAAHVREGAPYRKQTDVNATNITNLEKDMLENRGNIGLLAKEIKSNFIKSMIGNGVLIAIAVGLIKLMIG